MAAVLYGRQAPTFRYCPGYGSTDGGRCSKFLSIAGMNAIEWQDALLDDWLATTPLGRWANPTCTLSVPRQNGKTRLVAGRAGYGMRAYGEWVVYTSHLQKTSTETFEEMAAMFDTPKLRPCVKVIKTALGREEIVLKNGGRCKFLARTRNGGRGQHGDLWIADEAQELSDEQQGSFLPLLAASRNPQTIYLGTPPDENASGEVFTRLRNDAMNGTGRTAYAEWSVSEIGDVSSRERWAETNPSFGYLINEDTVQAEFDQMARDRFARERLGWWSPAGHVEHLLDAGEWEACTIGADAAPEGGGRGQRTPSGTSVCFGVKIAPDDSCGSLAACVRPRGGIPHVELVSAFPMDRGISWLADWLMERKASFSSVAIDGRGSAAALAKKLTVSGLPKMKLLTPGYADAAAAYSMMRNAVRDGEVTHLDDEALADSATKSAKRKIGNDGGFGFASTQEADSTPIEAASLALWATTATRFGQNIEMGLSFL